MLRIYRFVGALAAFLPLVSLPSAAQTPFTNSSAIVVNHPSGVDPTYGSSDLAVSGLSGTVSKVTVTLHNVSHTLSWFNIAALLRAPDGTNLVLTSYAADDEYLDGVTNVTMTFDDAATEHLPLLPILIEFPDGANLTYKPTAGTPKLDFPICGGACQWPYQVGSATLATFNGMNPNGTWSLHVRAVSDAGTMNIAGGWTVTITTAGGTEATSTSLNSSPNPAYLTNNVTFTATVTSGGSPVNGQGSVTLKKGSTTLAGPTTINSSGQAAFTISGATLGEGTHTITAEYGGAAGYGSSSGTVSQTVKRATVQTGNQFCNTGPVTIPQTGLTGGQTGHPSHPYPSYMDVSLAGAISKLTVDLKGVTHQRAVDVDMLLVSPTGEKLVLWSDVSIGSLESLSNVNVTLDDAAESPLPRFAAELGSGGTYRPTSYDGGDVDAFPAPAPPNPLLPAPEGSSTLGIFNGNSPTGEWKLFVADQREGSTGSMSGGWCLNFVMSGDAATATTVASSANPSTTGDSVTITATVTAGGAPVAGSGSVTFYAEDNTVLAGPVALNGAGQASFSKSDFAEGRHAITARYSGAPGTYAISNGAITQEVIDATSVTGNRFCNPGSVSIPTSASAKDTAALYPVRINVSGLVGGINTVTVGLTGLTYSMPSALQMLLVGPAGTVANSLDFFSHTANTTAVSDVDLTFSDAAPGLVPGTTLVSRTYQPTSRAPGNTYEAPAPTGPYQYAADVGAHTLGSVFGSTNPNGNWSLYIARTAVSEGSISGPVCVEFTMTPPSLSVEKSHSGNFTAGQTGATYSISVTNNGPGSTSGTVTVTDALPAGLTATAIGGTGWNCTLATLTCTRSDALAPGGTYDAITLMVNVATDAPSSVTNSATVSGGGDPTPATGDDPTTIIQLPDLTVAKTHTGNFYQGQTGAQYTVTVTNSGQSATSGAVTVEETAQTGMTVTGLSGTGWSCVLGTLTCTRSDALAAGASYPPITVTVTVAPDAPASFTNSVTVSGGGESDAGNNIANDPTGIDGRPNLTMTKTHIGDFRQGQSGATYTLTVTNAGRGPTSGEVTVTDALPAGLAGTGFVGGGLWACTLSPLRCTRSDALAGGGSYEPVTLTASIATDASATIVNAAAVSGGGEIYTSDNGASDVTTVAPAPDMVVGKTHSPASFTQGQTGLYTFTVTNAGAGPTVGTVTLTESLPAGLSATGANWSGTGWSCADMTCTRSDVLAAGASYPQLSLTVSVAANAPASVTNTVSVSGGGEWNTSNNTATDPTTIIQLADPAVTKTHVGHFTRGQQGTYTITVQNLGSAPTTGGVAVTDTLPAGMTPAAMSGDGWTCTLSPLSCAHPQSRATGESYPPITLTVDVAADAATPLANSATVTGASDVNPANSTATDVTVVLVVPEIGWATPASIVYGTTLSAAQLNASAAVPGAFAYSPDAGTVLPAGQHTLNVIFTPYDPNTYAPASAGVSLTVDKATPLITWPEPAPIAYGTALSGTQLNASAAVPGSFEYSPVAGSVLAAGSHTLGVTFTPTDTANYNAATASVTQSVNKLTPVITWPAPAPIAYGTVLGAAQLNASTTVAGTFAYSPAAGVVLAAGVHTLGVAFTPNDTANINAATASVTQEVVRATPVVTWPGPAPIAYGTALSAAQLNASATVAGSFVYSPPAGTVLPPGNHALGVTFTPTDTANYNNAAASVTLVVNPQTPVLTWAAPAAITYGTALGTAQLNASANVPGAFVYSPPAGTVLPAGSHTLNATFTPADPNYTTAAASVTLEVNQAVPAIAWAAPAAIAYGTPLGAEQLNATANVSGTFAYSPAAGAVLPAGSHTLHVTFTPVSADYSAAAADVLLTVSKAPQTISFGPLPDRWHGDLTVPLQATASSGLPVEFTVVYGPATVGGSTLRLTGVGHVTVRAWQAGDGNWQPAALEQSFRSAYRVRVQAGPGLIPVSVDGRQFVSAETYLWDPGTTHRIAAPLFQEGVPGTGYRFGYWSDGGAPEHDITITGNATYAATFVPQFQLRVEVQPDDSAGRVAVTPESAGGFYDAGAKVKLEATPENGFHFSEYTGGVASGNRTQTVEMTAARTVVAHFTAGMKLDAVVDSAGYRSGPLAPGGLYSLFGWGMGSTELASPPLGTTLGGRSLTIRDRDGTERQAVLLYVSERQVNFVAPEGLAVGPATLRLTDAAGDSAELAVDLAAVAPGLFTAAQNGRGAPSGTALRVAAGGARTETPLAECGPAGCVPAEIDPGGPEDQVFLVLYGTGLRHGTAAQAKLCGVEAPVLYAGPHSLYEGLDQINLSLPRELAGRGECELIVTVNGIAANAVQIRVR